MRPLSRQELTDILLSEHINKRLGRELRFVPEAITDWSERELLAISTRSKSEGLLYLDTSDRYVLPYELTTHLKDNATGRARPVTCDFCYTWQQGAKAGRITFMRKRDQHRHTFICCADLNCSSHVRGNTPAALLSRTQLHEDMTTEQRITRLRSRLQYLVDLLERGYIASD